MKKTMKKIIPSVLMLLVSAMLVGTSTYAWFAMNNKVTMTGMTITTKVSNNLLISSETDADPTDNNYVTSLTGVVRASLEPVSTTKGIDYTAAEGTDTAANRFYYTHTTNVDSKGDAIANIYEAYDSTDTDDFNENYLTTGYVGYADYKFTLKANNSASAPYLDITKLNLTYAGEQIIGNAAFRVALLVEKWDGSAWGTITDKTILRTAYGEYFSETFTYTVNNDDAPTGAAVNGVYPYLVGDRTIWSDSSTTASAATKWYTASDKKVEITPTVSAADTALAHSGATAVNSVSELGAIANLDAAATIDGAVGTTGAEYYRVTIRLWLEGEDKSCNIDTFADLNDRWNLDVEIKLQNSTERSTNAPVTKIASAATTLPKLDLSSATLSGSNDKVIDGVTYYAISGHSGYFTLSSGGVANDSRIFYIDPSDPNPHPFEVTDRCDLPAAP